MKACCEHFGLNLNTYKSACRRIKYPPVVRKEQARAAVVEASADSRGIYGYRRIHTVCRQNGWTIGEKTVRAIMDEENLHPRAKRSMGWRSYLGETAHRPANKLLVGDLDDVAAAGMVVSRRYMSEAQRRRRACKPDLVHDFYADAPNQKYGTDVTEFSCADGKVYFSPLIDFYDNMPIVYTMGTKSDAGLTNTMLEAALSMIGDSKPVIHSDRGWHYRNQRWINLLTDTTHNQADCKACQPAAPCDDAWIAIPSLSRLAKSGDNARVEGFFGLVKRELYAAGIDSRTLNAEEFMGYLETYLDWYVHERLTSTPDKGYTTLAEQRALAKAI